MRLVFVVRHPRAFNGETPFQSPLGGTQSAVVYLARELATLGHEVHVFAHCAGLEGCFAGVHYHNLKQLVSFCRAQPPERLIAVADEQILKLGLPAEQTYWWAHNDYAHLWDDPGPLRQRISHLLQSRADRLLVVSRWQQARLAKLFALPTDMFYLTHNGVHLPHFARLAPEPALPPRLLYTSVPDRGLELLLQIFPRLQAVLPELELHLYSSFEVWGQGTGGNAELARQLEQQARALKQVFFHAPLAQPELAKALAQGTLWLYPNHAAPATGFWAETSCIAALEAQAAGLPVVASARGALPETVLQGQTGCLIDGQPESEAFLAAFVQQTLRLLQDTALHKRLAQAARQRIAEQFSWQQVAQQWSAELFSASSQRQQGAASQTLIQTVPQLAVVICYWQQPQQLQRCLTSLLHQDLSTVFPQNLQNFPQDLQGSPQVFQQSLESFPQSFPQGVEVLVCDGSPEASAEAVVQGFAQQLKVRYLKLSQAEGRGGLLRNQGIENSTGRLLLFVEASVELGQAVLACHLQAHQTLQRAVSSLCHQRLYAQGRVITVADLRGRTARWNAAVHNPFDFAGPVISVKRQHFKQVGGFDTSFVGPAGYESVDLALRLQRQGLETWLLGPPAEALQATSGSTARAEHHASNWQTLQRRHGSLSFPHALPALEIEVPHLDLETPLVPCQTLRKWLRPGDSWP